jgi:signal transduction histidine kinase
MAKVQEYLVRWSRTSWMVMGLVLTTLLGGIDYLTGPELSFSIFYLIPISLLAWQVGRRAGIAISIVSAASWLAADLLSGRPYAHPTVPYWNTVVRLGFFLITTYALSTAKAARERQEELMQFIVHDLRAPLANVMTGLQTLQDIAGEAMDDAQRNLVQSGLISCSRMLTLINSLLDLAKLESGQMVVQLEETGVEDVVGASLDQVSVWAKRNRVTLASSLDSGVSAVFADPVMTMRVLVNLLSNAIKFSPPESTVMVRVSENGGSAVTFSVIDQGQGIPREWANRVFDKFVQVEARRAGKTIGSGLGLTFCRMAVERQGGRIWLESQIDQGTTVTFTLPKQGR